MRVNGFYGHIAQKHARSLVMFVGFVVACQIAFAVLLTVPIIVSGKTNFIFVEPLNYFQAWGVKVFIVSAVIFAIRYQLHAMFLKITTGYAIVTAQSAPRLYHIVEPLAITAGIPMPKVGIMPSPALNAFACGLSQKKATIVTTQGLVNALDDDELAAVIAHEIAHIMNGDMNMMAVANASVGTVDLIHRINPFRFRGTKTAILAVLILPLLFLFAIFGFAMSLAQTVAKISRLLIASSREYIADAEAVRLTHNPGALISALRKIEGRSTVEGLDPMASAMMIDGPVEGEFASHPLISERIAVLTELSGAMIYGTGVRRDTRPHAGVISPSPVFAREAAQSVAPVAKPRKNLIDRVNAGSERNAIGLTPKLRKIMGMAVLGVIVMQMLFTFKMQRSFQKFIVPAAEQTQTSEQFPSTFRAVEHTLDSPRQTKKTVSKPAQLPVKLRGTQD